jgi:hypothetical protein
VWSCVASSVLVGDIANQIYEARLGNAARIARSARMAADD